MTDWADEKAREIMSKPELAEHNIGAALRAERNATVKLIQAEATKMRSLAGKLSEIANLPMVTPQTYSKAAEGTAQDFDALAEQVRARGG